MSEYGWLAVGILIGFLVGVSIGLAVSRRGQVSSGTVIFERDESGRVVGIHYVER